MRALQQQATRAAALRIGSEIMRMLDTLASDQDEDRQRPTFLRKVAGLARQLPARALVSYQLFA
jgi:hypothetical protein